jgi:hypothetical protein
MIILSVQTAQNTRPQPYIVEAFLEMNWCNYQMD